MAYSLEVIKNHFKPSKIILSWEVYQDIKKIIGIADGKDTEVSWIGEVEKRGSVFYIYKIALPKQTVAKIVTTIEEPDMMQCAAFSGELNHENFHYWGHLHPKGVFVSPTEQDRKNMIRYAGDCDYFVGTIHDPDGALYGYFIDGQTGLYHKDVPVEVEECEALEDINEKILELWKQLDALEGQRDQIESTEIEAYLSTSSDWETLYEQRVKTPKQERGMKTKSKNDYFVKQGDLNYFGPPLLNRLKCR